MTLGIPTYVLCNLMCIAVFTVLSYRSSRQYRILRDERLFLEVMLASVIMFISDIIWYLIEGTDGKLNRAVNIISCAIYLIMTVVIGYLLLVYIDYKYCKRTENQFYLRALLYSVPLVIFVLITLTSQYSGWIYYIDGNNNYHRGPAYFVQVLLSFGYVVYATVLAHVAARYFHNSRATKREISSLSIFSLMALCGGILQVAISEIPVLGMTLTVSVLYIYLSVQSKQIYIDTLCGINNRRQFNIYIDYVLSGRKRKQNVYLLMMDIDKFKLINDTYGHIEGDYALIKVAEILAKVCSDNDDFVARYGGDEFAIVCYRKTDEEIDKLKIRIIEELNIANKLSDKPYDILLSIGSAKLSVETDTQESAIMKADEQLYEIKAKREAKV